MPYVKLMRALAVAGVTVAMCIGSADAEDAPEPAIAASLADALQVAHRLLIEVSGTFACNVPYDASPPANGTDNPYLITIYGKGPSCQGMLHALNTWGSLYGVAFTLAGQQPPAPEAQPPNRETRRPRDLVGQDLIHEIDPPLREKGHE
jgi:hypothetical protein